MYVGIYVHSTWTNGRILQQLFGHLQKYMTILYNFVDLV